MIDQKSNAGGAAMGGGAEYQARVAAWLGAYMVAEADAEPPFGLTSQISSIACETGEPVDDVLVRTAAGNTAYLQAKRRVTLDRRRKTADGNLTPLASAIDQFVRQYLLQRERAEAGSAAMLDPAHDRLVLAVGQASPTTISRTLAGVLDRIRVQSATEPLVSQLLNQQKQHALDVFLRHARESWEELTGSRPADAEVHAVLQLVHIETVAVEDGESGEEAALMLLRQSILANPNDARSVWSVLVQVGSRLIRTRSSVGGPELRRLLIGEGIQLRAPRSYREDIERLRPHSAAIVGRLADYASIPLGAERVAIDRPYTAALWDAAGSGSILVIGKVGSHARARPSACGGRT